MSLLRNSIIVGAATTLVGVGLMELSSESPLKTPKPSWYVKATLLTGLAGALGYALVNNSYTPEALELNTDSYFNKEHDCYQCGKCLTAFDHEIDANYCCTACYACGYADHVGWRTQWCCPCNCAETGGGPNGTCQDTFSAEGPTDDELESWSERQDDGSMLVMIDEDGDSHTELTYDDEGELTNLKRFMAEVFEATKPRRRTTLTWTRGYDPAFVSMDGDRRVFADNPRPYHLDYYRNSNWNTEKNAYHIKGLPEGYHIHLWKPNRRGNYWQLRMKSPHGDGWQTDYNFEKKEMMGDVLHWYNRQIAIPQKEELTPMMLALKQMGGVSEGIHIQRIEVSPMVIQYFYSGKDAKGTEHEPTMFAECMKSRSDYVVELKCNGLPSPLLNFVRGLIYIGEEAGNNRNVNRYNDDRKMWVNSKPAWFKNMCKQGIKQLYFTTDTWDENTIKIFNTEFFKFEASKQTFMVRLPNAEGYWEWHTPRPSTVRKMKEKLLANDPTATSNQIREFLFYEAVKKYQPQKLQYYHDMMLSDSVCSHWQGFGEIGEAAGQLMCRRFKKNEK